MERLTRIKICMIRFKKTITLFILIFLFTFIQSYWSMHEFRNSLSSSCLNCGFLEENIFVSFVFSVILISMFSVINYVKIKTNYKTILKIISIIFVWFFINIEIFRDRESSWSTYSFSNEIYYTIRLSVFPMLLLIIVLLFLEKKTRSNSSLQE